MEKCEHGELYEVLHNYDISLSWKFRLKVATDIANAMEYLHGNFFLNFNY